MWAALGASLTWALKVAVDLMLIMAIFMVFARSVNVITTDKFVRHPFYVLIHVGLLFVTVIFLARMVA